MGPRADDKVYNVCNPCELGKAESWRLSLIHILGQLLTHFSNDYFDLVADQLHPYRPQWSGGSGVLPAGLLPARWALIAACCAGVAALLSAAWLALVIRPGALTALLLGMAIGVAWSYSSPPLRLHATGFGEVAGAGLLAILTPLIGYHLQGGTRYASTVLALLPMAALQLAMLINVSLPDKMCIRDRTYGPCPSPMPTPTAAS